MGALKLPAKHCRYCGDRIQVTTRLDGTYRYKRSENFCTMTCAELFAEECIRRLPRRILRDYDIGRQVEPAR